jgi:glycolate oxidase subunit GlcD|tara:strand:+ start:823 stop:2217 length:1395 start_codon:yes stop_codon:yes gene_type:complete
LANSIDHIASIAEIVGADNLVSDDEAKQVYGLDWTRFYSPAPLCVVFPKSIEVVQALVLFASKNALSLVPSGGRTGLSGGAVACNGEVVVSFEKMNQVLEFDPIDQVVTVQPGLVTEALQQFAEDQGLFYPVDFASAGSSQIGGNLATNAGGIKVLKYGLTRDWVVGLKVVTGAGELLDLNRSLIKNATGYDLRHLFVGSEGTLGFIVEASMKLAQKPNNLTVALLAVPDMANIISVMTQFREHVELTAFEFFSDKALEHVLAHSELSRPFADPSAFYALIEFDQRNAAVMDAALAAFESCVESGIAVDGVISQSEQQRKDIWRYREGISEAITPHTPYKNDVSVRVSKVPAFLKAVDATVTSAYPEFEIVWFGHIGDGNLHLNILKPTDWPLDRFKRECEAVSEQVMKLVQKFAGSVSAEHGVGLLKRDQLKYSRSAEEIEIMKAMKRVFDPAGIMNPGKLLV